jgi:hypothetical protein
MRAPVMIATASDIECEVGRPPGTKQGRR